MYSLKGAENWGPSHLDSKIKPVNPKGNQSWIFIGRTDVEAEASILWPPDSKSQLIGKRPWCWERLRAGGEGGVEDEMVGWHHWLNGQIWANSKRQWGRGKSGLLQSLGLQRVGHDWVIAQPHNGDSARNTLTKWSWSSPLQLQVTLPKSSQDGGSG